MVVRIDEPGQNDVTGQIDSLVGVLREIRARADLLNPPVANIHAGVAQFAALLVHGHEDIGVANQECAHCV